MPHSPYPQPQQIEFVFPFKGLHESSAVTGQPDGTTGTALNVRGYDSIARRDRGGQRPGLVRENAYFTAAQVDAICEMTQTVLSAPTALVPAKCNRAWGVIDTRTLNTTTTTGSVPITDIAMTVALTITFSSVNDLVTVRLAPDTNPSGYFFELQVAAQRLTGTQHGTNWGVVGKWLNFTRTDTGGSAAALQLDPGFDPPIGSPFTLIVSFRKTMVYIASTNTLSSALMGDDKQTGFAGWDWTGVGTQSVSYTASFSDASGQVIAVTEQPTYLSGGFPVELPMPSQPDGGHSEPVGITGYSYYTLSGHGFGALPNPATTSHRAFLSTEYFTLGTDWTITLNLTITKTENWDTFMHLVPAGANGEAGLVPDDATGAVVSLDFGRLNNQDRQVGYVLNGVSSSFGMPSSYTTGPTTVVITQSGGVVTITFDGVVMATWSQQTPTGLYTLHLQGTSDPTISSFSWTNASVLSSAPVYSATQETVLVACGGNLYISGNGGPWSKVDTTPIGGGSAYATGVEMSICAAGGYYWIVDGSHLTRVNGADGTIDRPAATAGTLPSGPRLVTLYRDRLFFSRFVNDPMNYIASKSGDYLNFDASDTSVTGAFAGNNAPMAGLLGEPITAMIPYGDQTMIMGMANSVAVMRGDPKAGGSIDALSREVGVVGPTAWARDPDGNFYFMAKDGLYQISGLMLRGAMAYLQGPTGMVKPVSRGRLDETLGEIDFQSTKVLMAWDPREYGLKIYLLPSSDVTAATVVYWEQRKDAFWLDEYPPIVGPTAVATLTGQNADGRKVLLGGWDGRLRRVDLAATDDDGTAISSVVQYTPVSPLGALEQTKLTSLRMVWGSATTFNAVYGIRPGDDAVVAVDAPLAYTNTVTAGGYQQLDRTRVRGASLVLEISNDVLGATWQIEKATGTVLPGGRVRT